MANQPKHISTALPYAFGYTDCCDCGANLVKTHNPRCYECSMLAEAKWENEANERYRKSKIITHDILSEFGRMSNIPIQFYQTGFRGFDTKFNHQEKELAQTVKYAKAGKWVIFSGVVPGIGKTRLAVDSLKYAYLFSGKKDWRNIYVRNHPEAYHFYEVRRLALSLYTAGVNLDNLIESVITKSGLVFDEMGGENEIRDGFQSKVLLEMLIEGIYNKGGLLLITTPLSSDKFFDLYDGRITDRLGERAEMIEMTGKSYRQK